MFDRFVSRVRRARSKAATYGAIGFVIGGAITSLGVSLAAASSKGTARNEAVEAANCESELRGRHGGWRIICDPPERVDNVTAIANEHGNRAFYATWDLYFPSIPILGTGIGVILGGIYGFVSTPPSVAVPVALPPPAGGGIGGRALLDMDADDEDDDSDLERGVMPPPAAPAAIRGAAAGIALALDDKKISKAEVKAAEIKTMQQRYDEAMEALEKACGELKEEVKKVKIPKRFYCPVSQELMNVPVIASNSSTNVGRNYNKSHIENWLVNYKNTDPVDRSRNIDRLTLNIDLQGEIKGFVEKIERQARNKTAEAAKAKSAREAQEKSMAAPILLDAAAAGTSLAISPSKHSQEQSSTQPLAASIPAIESKSGGNHSPRLFPASDAAPVVSVVPAAIAAAAAIPSPTAAPRADTSLAAATASRRQRPQ